MSSMANLYIVKDVSFRPRKGHVPKSNGCGSLSVFFDDSDNSPVFVEKEFTECCDGHDICYDTCQEDKDMCDIRFECTECVSELSLQSSQKIFQIQKVPVQGVQGDGAKRVLRRQGVQGQGQVGLSRRHGRRLSTVQGRAGTSVRVREESEDGAVKHPVIEVRSCTQYIWYGNQMSLVRS